MIRIESGIPMPPSRTKYPYAQLAVGDSFSVELSKARSVSACVRAHARRTGYRYSVRRDGDCVRVWRVA